MKQLLAAVALVSLLVSGYASQVSAQGAEIPQGWQGVGSSATTSPLNSVTSGKGGVIEGVFDSSGKAMGQRPAAGVNGLNGATPMSNITGGINLPGLSGPGSQVPTCNNPYLAMDGMMADMSGWINKILNMLLCTIPDNILHMVLKLYHMIMEEFRRIILFCMGKH